MVLISRPAAEHDCCWTQVGTQRVTGTGHHHRPSQQVPVGQAGRRNQLE